MHMRVDKRNIEIDITDGHNNPKELNKEKQNL